MQRIWQSTTRMRPGLGLEPLEDRLTLSHAPLASGPFPLEAFEIQHFASDMRPALQAPLVVGQGRHDDIGWSSAIHPSGLLDRPSGMGLDFAPRMLVVQPMVIQFVLVYADFDFRPGSGNVNAPAPLTSRSEAPPPRGRPEPVAQVLSILADAQQKTDDATSAPAAARPGLSVGMSVVSLAVASAAPAAVPTNSAPGIAAPMQLPNGPGASIALLQPSLMAPVLVPPRGESLPSTPQSPEAASDTIEPSAAPLDVRDARSESQPTETPPAIVKGEPLPLLAGMSLNIEAIDEALQAMLSDVEGVGGELVTWLDELSPRSWVTVAATAAVAGAAGRYAWRARRRRQGDEPCEEESSSWLFTRFQSH